VNEFSGVVDRETVQAAQRASRAGVEHVADRPHIASKDCRCQPVTVEDYRPVTDAVMEGDDLP
jgi:hypothetical protein